MRFTSLAVAAFLSVGYQESEAFLVLSPVALTTSRLNGRLATRIQAEESQEVQTVENVDDVVDDELVELNKKAFKLLNEIKEEPPFEVDYHGLEDLYKVRSAVFGKKKEKKGKEAEKGKEDVYESGGRLGIAAFLSERPEDPWSKRVSTSPDTWRLATMAAVPVSAALGGGLMPSRNIAVRAAGAVVSGLCGAVGKSRVVVEMEKCAPYAVAQVLVDYRLKDPAEVLLHVQEVQKRYNVPDEEFQFACAKVFSQYIFGMVVWDYKLSTADIKEVKTLRSALGLSDIMVGQACADTAELYWQLCKDWNNVDLLERPVDPVYKAATKLLFLTDRLVRGDSDDASEDVARFEVSRVASALRLKHKDAADRSQWMSMRFYKRVLDSTLAKLGTNAITAELISKAKKSLGVRDDVADMLHKRYFEKEVASLLGVKPVGLSEHQDGDEYERVAVEEVVYSEILTDYLPDPRIEEAIKIREEEKLPSPDSVLRSATFRVGAYERLNKLRGLFGMSANDMQVAISHQARASYNLKIHDTISDVAEGNILYEEGLSKVKSQGEELLLKDLDTLQEIFPCVMDVLGDMLAQAERYCEVNNEVAMYKRLLSIVNARGFLAQLLTTAGWEKASFFDTEFFDLFGYHSVTEKMEEENRLKMYHIFLSRTARGKKGEKLSDENFQTFKEVQTILALSDSQAQEASLDAFGPSVVGFCEDAALQISENYSPELGEKLKLEIQDRLEGFRLPANFVPDETSAIYQAAVKDTIVKSGSGIPTPKMKAGLDCLQDMFQLEDELVYDIHKKTFGEVYKKCLLEAMGSTGIISPAFKEELGSLRERLGVRESDMRDIFVRVMKDRFIQIVRWINHEVERKSLNQGQLSRHRGKDQGRDYFASGSPKADDVLGIAAEVNIMTDILHLIDFYIENGIAYEEPDGTSSPSEPKKMKTIYPLTALGTKALEENVAEYLLRQFIVGVFQSEGEQAKRLERARHMFGQILGFKKEESDNIRDTMSNQVYDNFVSHALGRKGKIDQQDMMQLTGIQKRLDITDHESEIFLRRAQRKFLRKQLDHIMESGKQEDENGVTEEHTVSSADLRAFREMCNSLGFEPERDLELEHMRVLEMFQLEATASILNGDIDVDNVETVQEIQESLHLDESECEQVFNDLVKQNSFEILGSITAKRMKSRDPDIVTDIESFIRLVYFMDDEVGDEIKQSIPEARANAIYNFYESATHGDMDPDKLQQYKEVLHKAVGATVDMDEPW
eukprot:Nitzschia sp. Nitz4//scaffold7_size249615//24519//28399//NITZ4_001141-RA/size249615-augustus-gene-0.19-mRNA-1//-1//CDS//3329558334//1038//frame0